MSVPEVFGVHRPKSARRPSTSPNAAPMFSTLYARPDRSSALVIVRMPVTPVPIAEEAEKEPAYCEARFERSSTWCPSRLIGSGSVAVPSMMSDHTKLTAIGGLLTSQRLPETVPCTERGLGLGLEVPPGLGARRSLRVGVQLRALLRPTRIDRSACGGPLALRRVHHVAEGADDAQRGAD